MSALLLLVAAMVVALILAYWFPSQTKALLTNIMFARRILFGAIALLTAFIFLGTGNVILVLIGFAMFVIAAWAGYFQLVKGEPVF